MQGVANFALRRHGAGNSIHIVKFRLCKSAEKNCSEAGLYYSCLACRTGIIRPARTAHGNVGKKRAGAKMRSEHRQPPGTGSGYSGKAARAARKGAENTQKSAISNDKCPETALSMPDARISALNTPHERTAEECVKTLFVLFSKTPFLPRYASCFRARAGAITGGHAFQTPRSASRHNASCTLW